MWGLERCGKGGRDDIDTIKIIGRELTQPPTAEKFPENQYYNFISYYLYEH